MDARDLDMEGALVGWQTRQMSPDHMVAIAARATESGSGGEATAAVAGLAGRSNEEMRTVIDDRLSELLDENGGELLIDEGAVHRTLLRMARRIVSGEIRPGLGAMTIGSLQFVFRLRRPWEGPYWSETRPFYGAWEQIHPDVEPSDELIRIVEADIVESARQLVAKER